MKKLKTPLIALGFLLISVIFTATYRSFRFLLPVQQVELSHGVEYGAVVKDFLFVQEITLKKRYISGIDIYMAKLPATYVNHNVFVLLDEQHKILYTKRFSSEDFGEALYFPFDFGAQFDIGKGRKVYACIYSLDGDPGSYIGLAKKENSNLGKLYVVTIMNNDIIGSFEAKQSLVDFKGSIGARTFESDSRFFSVFQLFFYLLGLLVALGILFGKQVAGFIRKHTIRPDYTFLGYSLVFGLIMLVITPPFMVPDEPAHFYRSYQVSEFNFYKLKDDFPRSLTELSAICNRMQFSTHEKTSRSEILSLAAIKTNPAERTTVVTPDYTLPYLPQAMGIGIGRIFGLPPLWLFYCGRLLNLLASIVLIFFAIRTIPSFKWVFFMLGVMPMTLYQFASLSYDAVTIGLAFLFLALILSHAEKKEKPVTTREVILLLIVAALLAAAKQPYVVVALAFFIIPPGTFGSRKRYIAVAAGLFVSVAVVSLFWVPGRTLFEKIGVTESSSNHYTRNFSAACAGEPDVAAGNLHAGMLPMWPHEPAVMNAAQEPRSGPAVSVPKSQPQPNDATPVNTQTPVNTVDPASQKHFILSDPFRYIGILVNTLGKSANLYCTSFVGLFGWIDAPMPLTISYVYLAFLLAFSIFGSIGGHSLRWFQRGIFLATLILGFVLIETALYVYCNPVGCDPVTAVQGRYFIAIAPLLFLLFGNRWVERLFRKPMDEKSGSRVVKKHKEKQPVSGSPPPAQSLFTVSIPWMAALIAAITLACSIYVILERFYVMRGS